MKLRTTKDVVSSAEHVCVQSKHGRIKSNTILYERDVGLQLRTGVLWQSTTQIFDGWLRARVSRNVNENVVYGLFIDTTFGNRHVKWAR